MTKIKTERIDLRKIPMAQRKHIGMLCQRHLESKGNPGTAETLRVSLKNYIDAHGESDTRAARWMLARLIADPLAEINCRQYICQLLYG